jgi:uncharacterized membrane protein YtjA (UPF0391 family)
MKLVQYAIVLMVGAVLCRLFGWDRTAHALSITAAVLFMTFLLIFCVSVIRRRRS